MPTARVARQRALNNENDENHSTRVTRAKAAALNASTDASLEVKKPLQAKKGSANQKVSNDGQTRKRAALGDVSNVSKGVVGVNEGKKPAAPTGGSLAKVARPTGVQKASKVNEKRSILAEKDKTKGNDLKRSASASSVPGNAQKKRANSSTSSRRSSKHELSPPAGESSAAGQEEDIKIEKITQTTKVTKRASDGTVWEEEVKKTEIPEMKQTQPAYPSYMSMELLQEIENMDDEDANDPLMVSEYVYEILDYMKELEQRTMPNFNYMEHQKDLEWRMRGVLIDWLLEVHTRFHLLPETFYLTVNIIDRFLSQKVVQLERLQLVGVTAMFIASKYEEVLSPHIQNFVHVADDGFSEQEILSAERYILATLNYDLSYANPMHFMRRISKADHYDIQTRTLAKYLLEISLLDHRLMGFKPSENAAAAMFLSRIILGKGEWSDLFEHYSGYSQQDIMPAVDIMIDYLAGPVTHNAFYKKYAGKKFLKASLHARSWAKKYVAADQDGIQSKAGHTSQRDPSQ